MGNIQQLERPEDKTDASSKENPLEIDYMGLQARFCAPTHAPIPIVLSKARGAHVWDIHGNKYIDFLSAFSVVIQGHSHPRVVDAMVTQCQKLALCTSAFQNEHYPLICKKMCELLGYDMASAANSGSEGVDLAIKIARKWAYNVKGVQPDKAKILTLTESYHGKSLGPLSSSSFEAIKTGFGPFVPGIGPDIGGFNARFNNIDDIKKTFEACGKEMAAVIVECVQGFAGCVPAEPGFLQAIQNLCREHDVLFVADEIQTGFGRTGKLMAYQHDNVKPDMVVLAKALTAGMYPMSMILGSREIMTQIKPGQHSSTFAANPLASAVAIAAVDVVLDEDLPGRAGRLGAELVERLSAIESPHTTVRVTGRGLLLSMHIDESHPSGRITADRLGRLVRKRGVTLTTMLNRLRIAPPVVIEEEDLWKGVDIIEGALRDLLDAEVD